MQEAARNGLAHLHYPPVVRNQTHAPITILFRGSLTHINLDTEINWLEFKELPPYWMRTKSPITIAYSNNSCFKEMFSHRALRMLEYSVPTQLPIDQVKNVFFSLWGSEHVEHFENCNRMHDNYYPYKLFKIRYSNCLSLDTSKMMSLKLQSFPQ